MTLSLVEARINEQISASERDAYVTMSETNSGSVGSRLARSTFIAFTSMTAATGLLIQPVTGSAGFETYSAVFLATEQPAPPVALWTPSVSLTASASMAPRVTVRSDREEVIWVKENSGLTWDQLGKVFGVSRRAVHLWASGGRMNEVNAKALRDFAASVARHLGESPEHTRASLLSRSGSADSVIDRFRRSQSQSESKVIRPPFAPEEKVENVREAEVDQA